MLTLLPSTVCSDLVFCAWSGIDGSKDAAFWSTCLSLRVTDGTRTRALRTHNPLSPVSECCRMLQNRLI
jgi:hypothetical protein